MLPRRRNNEESSSSNGSEEGVVIHHMNGNGTNSNGTNGNWNGVHINGTSSPSLSPYQETRKKNKAPCRILVLSTLVLASIYLWKAKHGKHEFSSYEDARKHYSYLPQYSTITNFKRNAHAASGKFVLTDKIELLPQIAWLMSFPNSGTSFTMTMVARSTNKSFATNYGNEVIADDEEDSLSIYPRRPEGPYWPGMSGKVNAARPLPSKYVMTKTHCGSRCSNCGPDEYIEIAEEFLKRCASGHGEYTPGNKRRRYDTNYPTDRVHRAIHLYRNPMHNIIARYHLVHRHQGYKNRTQWQDDHTNDAKGLHKYCENFRKDYRAQDEAFFGKQKIPKAPCFGEFYKWTQWHNLVHESVHILREGGPEGGLRRDFPVLKVYYEDYNTAFEQTTKSIFEFLELEQVAPLREFTSRSDYGDYFPQDELIEIKRLVKSVASNATWEDVKHYFDGVPDDTSKKESKPKNDGSKKKDQAKKKKPTKA